MRKLIVILLCCTFALLAGYAGFRGYKVWKQKRMMNLARVYAAKGDARNTLLCVRQVLDSNPQNLEASRMMASLLEAGRSPAAILMRSHVVELNPNSLDDRLALAQTALMFRDYLDATNALEGVSPAGKKTANYHNIAGAVAAAANLADQAETHFLEAAKLEPQNPTLQLNLAVIRLHGSNAPAMAEARTALNQICADPTNTNLRCQALRELIVDAVRQKQNDQALALSKELVRQTNSSFTDRLLRLDVLRETKNPEFQPNLAGFQREASTNTAGVYELATWQITRTGPTNALAWLVSLPTAMQTNQAVAMLTAECRTLVGDWRGLSATLTNQNWSEMEFVRHAFLTRALRGQDLVAAAKGEWELALRAANNQKSTLTMLLRLAAQWNWQSEGEEILWSIVNHYPSEKWAVQALTQALYVGGRTRSLMSLYGQLSKNTPADLGFKNNLAMTALLLDAQELKPHDLAREVYQQAPTNSAFASTYAYSLLLQKKNVEALKTIELLKPTALEDPGIAGYYGLILKANGNPAKARTYLEIAAKAPALPEEKKLFQSALSSL